MKPEVADDSVDWTVKARLYGHPSPDVQLKATAQDVLEEDGVHFELKLKNYDELRDTNLLYPRLLIVVVLPGDDPAGWIPLQDEERLALSRCGYWLSLRGYDPHVPRTPTSKAKPTVVLPRKNILTPQFLTDSMNKIGNRILL